MLHLQKTHLDLFHFININFTFIHPGSRQLRVRDGGAEVAVALPAPQLPGQQEEPQGQVRTQPPAARHQGAGTVSWNHAAKAIRYCTEYSTVFFGKSDQHYSIRRRYVVTNSGSAAGCVHAEDGLEGVELQLAELDHGRRDVHARRRRGRRHRPRDRHAEPVGRRRAAEPPRSGEKRIRKCLLTLLPNSLHFRCSRSGSAAPTAPRATTRASPPSSSPGTTPRRGSSRAPPPSPLPAWGPTAVTPSSRGPPAAESAPSGS